MILELSAPIKITRGDLGERFLGFWVATPLEGQRQRCGLALIH